ncbi:uncharacterized protein [Pyxicephalus adspersus]|uniref:uncharacterized protein n=1 Tax=Pyxicephalus adspersus TaxID=30357 RepID=UPI003B5A5610
MSSFWLWLFVLLQVSSTFPMYVRNTSGPAPMYAKPERTAQMNNLIKKQKENQNKERIEIMAKLTDRWSKGQDILRYHRTQCNHMNQSWTHWQDSTAVIQDSKSDYTFRVFTGPLKATFPQRNLFQYVNRVYRCCKLGLNCPKIKGLQGTLEYGKNEINIYIDPDIFGLSIRRAELHLELLADEHLTIIPSLTLNGHTYSRFTQSRSGYITDLALDVMFLLHALKEKDVDSMAIEEVTELQLTLYCMKNELYVPCHLKKVSLLHSPFIALHY